METLTKDQKQARQQDEIQELRVAQMAGDAKVMVANKNPKYEIKEAAKDYVHVRTVIKNMAPGKKAFIDEVKIVAIHANQFDLKVSQGAFQIFDEVEVIHDPRKNAPEKYELKPARVENVGESQSSNSNGAASSAKLRAMKETEKRLAEAEARIDEKLAKLDALSQGVPTPDPAPDENPDANQGEGQE